MSLSYENAHSTKEIDTGKSMLIILIDRKTIKFSLKIDFKLSSLQVPVFRDSCSLYEFSPMRFLYVFLIKFLSLLFAYLLA
jgi:hypothetical protein